LGAKKANNPVPMKREEEFSFEGKKKEEKPTIEGHHFGHENRAKERDS